MAHIIITIAVRLCCVVQMLGDSPKSLTRFACIALFIFLIAWAFPLPSIRGSTPGGSAPSITNAPHLGPSTSTMIAPNGEVLGPGCVYFVANGASVVGNGTIINADGSKVTVGNIGSTCHESASPDTYGTPPYVANGNDLLSTSGNPIGTASADWTVPTSTPAPTCSSSGGQLLFYWNGLEVNGSVPGGELLQPVLAHGYNGVNYGCYYYIQSWYLYMVGRNNYSITTVGTTVLSGDSLAGYMDYIGTHSGSCCWWYLSITDSTYSTSESEFVRTSAYGGFSSFWWYFGGVLEAYSITSCADFPNGSFGYTAFSSQTLSDTTGHSITPSWTTATTSGTPQCSFLVSTGSTFVDLSY